MSTVIYQYEQCVHSFLKLCHKIPHFYNSNYANYSICHTFRHFQQEFWNNQMFPGKIFPKGIRISKKSKKSKFFRKTLRSNLDASINKTWWRNSYPVPCDPYSLCTLWPLFTVYPVTPIHCVSCDPYSMCTLWPLFTVYPVTPIHCVPCDHYPLFTLWPLFTA